MTRYYPIECEHGYDCCPECDAEALRLDGDDRDREAKGRTERYVDPFGPMVADMARRAEIEDGLLGEREPDD